MLFTSNLYVSPVVKEMSYISFLKLSHDKDFGNSGTSGNKIKKSRCWKALNTKAPEVKVESKKEKLFLVILYGEWLIFPKTCNPPFHKLWWMKIKKRNDNILCWNCFSDRIKSF